MSRPSTLGFSILELLVVLAIVGMVAAAGIPALHSIQSGLAVKSALGEIRSILQMARSRAIASNRHTAVRFERDRNRFRYAIYQDGDWDGVRNDDIARRIDKPIVTPREVLRGGSRAWIGLPPHSVADPDSGAPMRPGSSAIRFNRSMLCSFSPSGSGTSGSVFVTDGGEITAVIRVFGGTGRIRSQRFDRNRGRWVWP